MEHIIVSFNNSKDCECTDIIRVYKYMGQEIERKWLIVSMPKDIEHFPHTDIVQGYLCFNPVIRPRRDGNDYYLTYKGKGTLSREEYNLTLTKAAFEQLLPKCEGVLIDKTRYRIPLTEGLTAELDIFHGRYEGRVYVEVEFESIEAAERFAAPDWFGEEVTGKPGFSNADLALEKAAEVDCRNFD